MKVITVTANNGKGKLNLYKESNGGFIKYLTAPCYIGKNGISCEKKEGDLCTPSGVFRLSKAFGINKNPGTTLNYINITQNTYLVDDTDSKYYNKIIEKNENIHFNGGEHMIEYKNEYKYGIMIDYNNECVPKKGSGIFLHCKNKDYTYGCISVSESIMTEVLKQVDKDTIIVIE